MARAFIMGRYAMLQCGANYKMNYGGNTSCETCGVLDDENHRINDCKKWQHINRYNSIKKVAFKSIQSDDLKECQIVVEAVVTIWDLKNGQNVMLSKH